MELEEIRRALRGIDEDFSSSQFRPLDVYYAYRLIMGREPDRGGWQFWSSQSQTLEIGLATFEASPEARSRRLPTPELLVTGRGFSIYVDPSDVSVGRAISAEGDYEPHVSNFFANAMRAATGTFVDIGSNVGWFMLLASVVAPAARTVGFEPNTNNVQLALRSLARAQVTNSLIYPLSCSDCRKIVSFHFVGSNGVVSDTQAGSMLVNTVRADEMLRSEGKIVAIKIDVEGHEMEVMKGLDQTVKEHRPLIMTEYHPHCLRESGHSNPTDYLEMLVGCGYSLSVLERGNGGRETFCPSIADVSSIWEKENSISDARGTIHVDMVCRPV